MRDVDLLWHALGELRAYARALRGDVEVAFGRIEDLEGGPDGEESPDAYTWRGGDVSLPGVDR